VRSCNPRLGRFDSYAAPLSRAFAFVVLSKVGCGQRRVCARACFVRHARSPRGAAAPVTTLLWVCVFLAAIVVGFVLVLGLILMLDRLGLFGPHESPATRPRASSHE